LIYFSNVGRRDFEHEIRFGRDPDFVKANGQQIVLDDQDLFGPPQRTLSPVYCEPTSARRNEQQQVVIDVYCDQMTYNHYCQRHGHRPGKLPDTKVNEHDHKGYKAERGKCPGPTISNSSDISDAE
jgi:hypothetical protein